LPQGAHPVGSERAGRPRAAVALLRELIGGHRVHRARRAASSALLALASATGAPPLVSLALLVPLAPLALAACDTETGLQNNASVGVGPPVHVVGFNGASGTLPSDAAIQIAFDRLLNPASVTRQSFVLADKSGNVLEPIVTYDPVARVVTLRPSGVLPGTPWLTEGVTYSVTMGVAAQNDYQGLGGPRAIDGAVLPVKVVETFQVVTPPGTQTPSPDRIVSFCSDVLPIFQFRCSGGSCHAAPLGAALPAEGLILQTSSGVLNTALGGASHGRTSQESNTGPLAGQPAVAGRVFGVDMAIVDPVDGPGQSWLMYKVLLGQRRPIDQGLDGGIATCGPAPVPSAVLQLPSPQPAASLLLSVSEQAILSQYILGNQMPYPLNLPSNEPTPVGGVNDEAATLPLSFDELERVRAWIAQGAIVSDCASCPQ
jgi:hypothetical protein